MYSEDEISEILNQNEDHMASGVNITQWLESLEPAGHDKDIDLQSYRVASCPRTTNDDRRTSTPCPSKVFRPIQPLSNIKPSNGFQQSGSRVRIGTVSDISVDDYMNVERDSGYDGSSDSDSDSDSDVSYVGTPAITNWKRQPSLDVHDLNDKLMSLAEEFQKLQEKNEALEANMKILTETCTSIQQENEVLKREKARSNTSDCLPADYPPHTFAEVIIKVKFKHVDGESPQTKDLLDRMDKMGDVYKVRSGFKGRALIISNEKFHEGTNFSERTGTHWDLVNAAEAFRQLGFLPRCEVDCTKEQMIAILEEERARQDLHEQADAFVMVILSHGEEECVYGVCGDTLTVTEITGYFDGIHCPALLGKPKLFVFSACQGDTMTMGLVQPDGKVDTCTPSPSTASCSTQTERIRVHEKQDMFFLYGSVQGFNAWRDVKSGTWLIRSLVKKLMEHAHCDHMVSILNEVVGDVRKKITPYLKDLGGPYIQCPEMRAAGAKKWYLLPHLYPFDEREAVSVFQ